MDKKYLGGKISLLLSLLAVLIVVVFAFGLNQNIKGLDDQVGQLGNVEKHLAAIEQLEVKVAAMQEQIAAIDVEKSASEAVLLDNVRMMSQRLGTLSATVENDKWSAKLVEAMKLLQEVEADLTK